MHENLKICVFELHGKNVVSFSANPNTIARFPMGYSISEDGINEWLSERGIPATRNGISVDLGIKSVFDYMLDNLGLSLVDHYWLLPLGENLCWESVNLYTNSFRSSLSFDFKEDMQDIAGKTNFVPSASLKGDLQKKWVIDNLGRRVLIKGNYSDTCRQSVAEVFATLIHMNQNRFMYTKYDFIRISNGGKTVVGCQCPNFTSPDSEFISAIDICNMSDNFKEYKKPNSMNWYQYFMSFCASMGLDLQQFMDYMIMTDFLITNTDRHLNNFGVLRNSRTLQWLSYAPIFDSGNSLFYKSAYIPKGKDLLDIDITSFVRKEVNMLKFVQNRGLVDMSKLPSSEDLYAMLKVDKYTTEDHILRTVEAYDSKKRYLLDFQNGAKLWDYRYKRG